jgi:hypothetical protein
LTALRKQHYFLNYVPNIFASDLNESMTRNDFALREATVMRNFVMLKLLPTDGKSKGIKELMEVPSKDLLQKLDAICNVHLLD